MEIGCTSEKFMGLENKVFAQIEEFNRKIDIGQNLKLLVYNHGLNENGLENVMKEALKTYKIHGKIWI